MIKLGNNNIGKIYLGSNAIGKAYLGSNLVYQSGSPTPTPQPEFHSRLRFDGTAYIQTDIVLPQNGSIRFGSSGGETRKGNQGIINASNDSGIRFCIFLTTTSDSTKRVYAIRYDSGTTDASRKELNNYTDRPALFITPFKWGFGNSVTSFSKGSDRPTTGIQFGALSQSYRYTGSLGYFYIYDSTAQNASNAPDLRDNYTPIYTLRPCIYNGEAGYWCVQTETFYGNSAGEGQLTVEDN